MSDMMLKTPTAMDAEIGSPKREPKSGDSGCLAQETMGGYAVILPTPTAMDSTEATARMKSSQTKDGSMHSVTLARAVHTLLPTPVASDAKGGVSCVQGARAERPGLLTLEDWLEFHGLMPSPVAQDYRRRGPNSRQQGLPEVCHRLLHTPIADGLKKRTGKGQERMRAEDFEEMLPENAKSQGSKDGRASQLNPLFVGEMMGYPLEWLISPFLSGDGDVRP